MDFSNMGISDWIIRTAIFGVLACAVIGTFQNVFPATFGKAISTCLSKFFNFKGRASRPEYWWFYLFTSIISGGLILVDSTQALAGLFNIVFLFPLLAAGARRLHDTNRSGWWQLISITIIGVIPLIFWLSRKGSDQENLYGSQS
jgi:uncharacterized membrane protein YhaH (DUF805 family)